MEMHLDNLKNNMSTVDCKIHKIVIGNNNNDNDDNNNNSNKIAKSNKIRSPKSVLS